MYGTTHSKRMVPYVRTWVRFGDYSEPLDAPFVCESDTRVQG